MQKDEMVEIRWKIPKRIHKKIALYQKDKEFPNLEAAGTALLDRVTEKIKLIEA